jgi:hypothetical protein
MILYGGYVVVVNVMLVAKTTHAHIKNLDIRHNISYIAHMKVTKSCVLSYIKHQLSTNSAWALRALTTIYARQTQDEQASGVTNHHNDIGFSGADAEILSSFAVQYSNRGTLSPKQMALVFKKMPKYSKQVLSCISQDKLTKVQNDALLYKNSQLVLCQTHGESQINSN